MNKKQWTLIVLAVFFLIEAVATGLNDRVHDPNRVLTPSQTLMLRIVSGNMPVKTHVFIYRDLSLNSLGEDLAAGIKNKNPLDPAYYPAGEVLDTLALANSLGEFSRGEKSLAVLTTTMRADKRNRWAISATKPLYAKLTPKNNGKAYMAFATSISGKHTEPATPAMMTIGTVKGLIILSWHLLF